MATLIFREVVLSGKGLEWAFLWKNVDKETQGKDLKVSSLPWPGPGFTDV
jgi:hypothetical protein